jgi:hypothetical protein
MPHLKAVYLDAPAVVDVHVLPLRRRPEELIVQEAHIADRLPHLYSVYYLITI